MFRWFGRFIVRHPIVVILIWSVVIVGSAAVAVFGVGGPTVFSQLETERPGVPGSDSEAAYAILGETSSNAVNLIVRGVDLQNQADVVAVAGALTAVRPQLAALDHVVAVTDPFQAPPDGWPPPEVPAGTPYNAQYLSADGRGFVLSVTLAAGLERPQEKEAGLAVADRLREVGADLTDAVGGDFLLQGYELTMEEMNQFMERELVRGEAISLPAALIVLVVVFGGLLAAAMPAIGAVATILTGLGGLILLNAFMRVDSVVVNVITIIGLGLSIDYGLLIVSRCREELHLAGASPDGGPSRHDPLVLQAVRRTHATAGRTVMFSALTIAVCCLSLVVMRPTLLQGIGVGGALAVVLAMLSATTFVPAVLVLHGRRFLRPSPLQKIPGVRRVVSALGDVTTDRGVFASLARWVQRWSWAVCGVVLVLLVGASALVSGIQMRTTGIGSLSEDMPVSQAYAELDRNYPYLAEADLYVVTTGPLDQAAAAALGQEIGGVGHVASVVGPVDLGTEAGNLLYQLRLDVPDPGGLEATEAVDRLRALGEPILVAGTAADQMDFKDALIDGLPWAGTIVVVAVFILLFLMTASFVVPVKALLTNGLSILASLGIATWIFTTGHGFPTTGIEIYGVAIVVAFGFGLAMDYEVFLLDRIKEIHDRGETTDVAVSRGLQRSGRIITSAASVIIVVFLGFATGGMQEIRQIGLTLGILVFLDATLVRMLLVPATMTILGKANWWAPGVFKRLGSRFAIAHAAEDEAVVHAGEVEPVAGAAEDEPVAHAAEDEPVVDAAGGQSVVHAAEGEPVDHAAGSQPVAHAAENEPVAHAADDEPVVDAAGGRPVADAARDEPVADVGAGGDS